MTRHFSGLLIAAAMFLGFASGGDDGFEKWWLHFQAAVAKGDAPAVVERARFPMNWENGPTREIRTKAEFTERFSFYFTPEIRKAIARGKPERYPTGEYLLTWKARGNEYSLYFDAEGDSFRLNGLSEGPP
jgi:hypothetical protein